MEENIVIVVDTSNYKSSYSEKVPFKAKITDIYDSTIWVKSITTHKTYELYFNQILEFLDIKEIKLMLDLTKYGNI